MTKNTKTIGIDIGGVIISRANDKTDTSFFGSNYLKTTAVADAFESIAKLARSGYRVYLVSKCGESIELKTRHWLQHHRFYETVGIAPEDVRFCRTRPEKATICAELGATHFVDDRLEVLSYLTDVPNRFLFSPEPKEVAKFRQHLDCVTRVDSWSELVNLLLKDHAALTP